MRAITISLNDWRKQSGLTCSFIIFAALNVAFMYVGITNLHSCPAEKMVPIYLVGKGQVSHVQDYLLYCFLNSEKPHNLILFKRQFKVH